MAWKTISAKYVGAMGRITTQRINRSSEHKIQSALVKQLLAVRVTLAKQVRNQISFSVKTIQV